jgi:hypothetical protein
MSEQEDQLKKVTSQENFDAMAAYLSEIRATARALFVKWSPENAPVDIKEADVSARATQAFNVASLFHRVDNAYSRRVMTAVAEGAPGSDNVPGSSN